jgi:hypothetical protein
MKSDPGLLGAFPVTNSHEGFAGAIPGPVHIGWVFTTPSIGYLLESDIIYIAIKNTSFNPAMPWVVQHNLYGYIYKIFGGIIEYFKFSNYYNYEV